MNLQIPVNLLKYGKYAGNYPFFNLFPPEVQTGWPVLIPIFVLFLIFGISDKVALSINSFFIIVLFALIFKICKKIRMPSFLIGLLLCWIIYTPDIKQLSMGIYGEIPALCFILSSIYILYKYEGKETPFIMQISGIMMGLAFSTKTVTLIAIPSFLFIFILKFYYKKGFSLRYILYFIIGFIIPSLLFELYKISQIGFEQYYYSSINIIKEICSQAGVSIDSQYNLKDTTNILDKIYNHLLIFSIHYETKPYFLIILLLFNMISFCLNIKKQKLTYIYIITLLSFLYFIWWLGITPTEKTYQRRILIGGICLQLSTSFYIFFYLKRFLTSSKINLLNFVSLTACCFLIYPIMLDSKTSFSKNTYLSFINKVKEFDSPNTIFCGIDWYQSPIVSFYLNKNFYDLNRIPSEILKNKNNKFYFISSERPFLKYDISLLPYATKLLFKDTNLMLFFVDISKPYNNFSEDEILSVKNFQLGYRNSNPVVRRIYKYDKNISGFWVQNNAAILLKHKYKGSNTYVIKYNIPTNIKKKDFNYLSIKVGNQLVYNSLNEKVGNNKIYIKIPSEYFNKRYIDFYFESNIEYNTPYRVDKKNLAFILVSIKPRR